MPYENIREGQRVTARGKVGTIMEVANQVKVKFDDGSFSFFDKGDVTPVVDDTRLKQAPEAILQHPEAAQADPLSQPKHATERGVAQDQEVLGQ